MDAAASAANSDSGTRMHAKRKVAAIFASVAAGFIAASVFAIQVTFTPKCRSAGFLRWEGPMVLPTDQLIRVDLLSGGNNGPAEPEKSIHD